MPIVPSVQSELSAISSKMRTRIPRILPPADGPGVIEPDIGPSFGVASITRNPSTRLGPRRGSLGLREVHVSIWGVPDTDKNGESGQTDGRSRAPQQAGHAWLSSLWLWPAVAIALTGIAGALFGRTGAVLVGGLALATLVLTAGVLSLSPRHRLAIATATPLIAALAVFVGLALAPGLHRVGRHPAPIPPSTKPPGQRLDWQWRTVSQSMARQANFRGADLDNANLDGLQLSHKDFAGVQAEGASFRGSQLEDASLRGASFQGACLEGANLMGADLTGANFSGADVAGVTVLPKAKKAALVWPSLQASPAAACQ
jgi:Pentapeptide repeats (8 copies)